MSVIPPRPVRPSLRILWMLPLLWVWSCLEPVPEVHYVSLQVEDSVTAFQQVRIVLLDTLGGDTLDVLWDGPLPDTALVKKVKVRRYRGGDALIIVRGFNQGQLLYERRIRYNSVTGIAHVDTPRVLDTIPPVLVSRIPSDTLVLESWSQFPDSLVECRDTRDGLLKRQLDTIARDIGLPSWYIVILYCRDLSRNSTWKYGDTLQVYMKGPPRPAKPVITPADRDSLELPAGSAFSPAAACRDAEDGDLPVKVTGEVKPLVQGKYVVTYGCRDRDGNEAARRQVVWIADALDVDPPVITFKGPDSLDHLLGTPYVDSGAECVDLRDGDQVTELKGLREDVNVDVPGVYLWNFQCRDKTGNTSVRSRKVRVVSFAVVPMRAEALMDTTFRSNVVNSGFTPILTFLKQAPKPDDMVSFMAFDLDGVARDSVKSAKAVFRTFVSGPYPAAPFAPIQVVFRAYRIKSPWVEGNGNWYYNRGHYQNGGHTYLRNHPMREEVKAHSTDPIVRSGVTKEDVSIFRISNMEEAGRDTVTLAHRIENFSKSHPGTVPAKQDLLEVEIDLTRYVRETTEGGDHGLVITVDGMPDNLWINWATKELGDGSMAPYLKLFH